ncbi:MAG TPA: GGDEF domain-containing protein [Planctomycetota bacterium]|nr:GGDEF domain-containing protein [Planctomycetota bacterium]
MKPHPVLITGAALISAVSLALGGWQLARSFSADARALDLAAPVVAVATALICITMLDWARNLPRRRGRGDTGDDGEEREGGAQRSEARPSAAEQELMAAVVALEGLARGEQSRDATIEEAIKVVAGFGHASAVALWLADENGSLRLRADYAQGTVAVRDGGAVDAADEAELQQVLECRQPLEAKGEDSARLLLPLRNGERCFGVLGVTVPAAAWGEAGEALQRLTGELARLAGPFALAIGALETYERAVFDAKTGVYSRRHLASRLGEAASFSRRYGEPLSMVLLDIDHFRMLNATFGASAGDRVLRTLASLITQNVRDADSVYRYGPDEFAVLLPNTEIDRARAVAERLRRIVRESRSPADDGNPIIATVSGGVAEFDEDMRGVEPLVVRAEEALGAARGGGRDRIQTWAKPSPAADQPAPS